MKRAFALGLVWVVAFSLYGCSKPEPKEPPGKVVLAFFDSIRAIKTGAERGTAGNTETDKLGFANTLKELSGLFRDDSKGKTMLGAWMLLKVGEVEILEETIDGHTATVRARVEVTGVGGRSILGMDQQDKPSEPVFTLVKKDGRWVINDMGGVFAKFGR